MKHFLKINKTQKLLLTMGLLFCGFWGCVSSKPAPRPLDLPFYRIYPFPYDMAWEAALNITDAYVIAGGDRESGEIKTEMFPARYNPQLFDHPKVDGSKLEEVQYKIEIKLSKGIVAQTGAPATRVQVLKQYSEFKNFFTDWRRQATDEVEENVILYRIGQRLKILDALKKKKIGSSKN